jgi:hypothetical protein
MASRAIAKNTPRTSAAKRKRRVTPSQPDPVYAAIRKHFLALMWAEYTSGQQGKREIPGSLSVTPTKKTITQLAMFHTFDSFGTRDAIKAWSQRARDRALAGHLFPSMPFRKRLVLIRTEERALLAQFRRAERAHKARQKASGYTRWRALESRAHDAHDRAAEQLANVRPTTYEGFRALLNYAATFADESHELILPDDFAGQMFAALAAALDKNRAKTNRQEYYRPSPPEHDLLMKQAISWRQLRGKERDRLEARILRRPLNPKN